MSMRFLFVHRRIFPDPPGIAIGKPVRTANMLENLGTILEQSAHRFGDKTALVNGDKRLSYRALHDLASRLASGLRQMGVGPGDRVTLYAPNSWQWVVSYYGALAAGAVINPINILLSPSEVAFVLKDCGASLLITTAEKAKLLAKAADVPTVLTMTIGEGQELKQAMSFANILASNEPIEEPFAAAPETLSTIAYTSGTTGHPKGAMHAHRSVLLNAQMTALMHVRTRHDIVVSALPCPHVYGNVVMNSTLIHGGTLVLHPSFDAAAIAESIAKERATMFEGVPTMYYYLLSEKNIGRDALKSLTRCTVGGQTMPVAKMREAEALLGCPLLDLWGMTEMAGLGSTHAFYGHNRHGSIGIPLPYTQLRIVDVDDGSRPLPDGEVGELMAKGPHVMMGYFNNEAGTREALEPDGWLHTGDLAYRDEEGYFYIVDRKKDMILTAGYNVYPAEIERVIASHPVVAMVAVGGIPDDVKGELAKAYIVCKPGATATEEEIIAHCRSELAAYKLPRSVKFVDDLPKTSTGKIMRRALRDLDA